MLKSWRLGTVLGFPVELWTGRLTAAETVTGFGVAAGWAVVLGGAYVVLWRYALQRYQAVAG